MGQNQDTPERKRRVREKSRSRYDNDSHTSLQDQPTPAMRRRWLAAYSLRVPVDTLPDEVLARFFAHIPALRLAIQNANRLDASHLYTEYLDGYFLDSELPTTAELGFRFGLSPTAVRNAIQRMYKLFHENLLIIDPELVKVAQSTIAEKDHAFWDRVKKLEGDNACWIWQGATDLGYGVVRRQGVKRQAHRYAYEITVGPIEEGMHLVHTCRIRNCVNPAHLYEAAPGEVNN